MKNVPKSTLLETKLNKGYENRNVKNVSRTQFNLFQDVLSPHYVPIFMKNVPRSMSHEKKLDKGYENHHVKKRFQDIIQLVSVLSPH